MIDKSELARARAGDREALNRILVAAETRLRRQASARLGADLAMKVETSDILQSTYLDVVHSVAEFAGEDFEDFITWTGRILENNIRDKRRFHGAKKRRLTALVDNADERLEAAIGSSTTPSEQAVFTEGLFRLAQALEEMGDDDRRVIQLRKISGFEYDAIAALMGRSEQAVRRLYSRAMARLLLAIEEDSAGDGRKK